MRIRSRTRGVTVGAAVVVAASMLFVAPAMATSDVVVDVDCGDVDSLIGAMANAAPTTIVNLNADGHDACVYTLTSPYVGSTGLPSVNRALTINGNGSTISRVSNFDFRIADVLATGHLNLVNVTIAGGRTFYWPNGSGGGINNSGELMLTDSTVTNNEGGDGGGIYSTGVLTITRSTVSGNTGHHHGGGVFNNGVLTVVNSTVSNNTTVNTAGEVGGGGIWSGRSATVTNSTLSDNSAIGLLSAHAIGGGIMSPYFYSELRLIDSTVTNNTTNGSGGGIYASGLLTLTASTVTSNSANVSAGGIYAGGPLTLTESAVTDNTSASRGGGIYGLKTMTIAASTVSGNSSDYGGGIFLRSVIASPPLCLPQNVAGGPCTPNVPPQTLRVAMTLNSGSLVSNNARIQGGGIFIGASDAGAAAAAAVDFAANTPNNCYPAGTVAGCEG